MDVGAALGAAEVVEREPHGHRVALRPHPWRAGVGPEPGADLVSGQPRAVS